MNATIPFTIRRFQSEDQEQVWNLHTVALMQTGAFLHGHGKWDDDFKDIDGHYLKNRGEFLVAEHQTDAKTKIIIAMGALRQMTEERGEIKRMRVLPEFQGQGLGKVILGMLEDRARELKYTVLQLDTSVLQIAAQKLYQKNGYKEIKRDAVGGIETIFFEKQL